MIYILEGPDGVGKSTLAKEIAEQKKAHVLHSSFNKEWDIYKYHKTIFRAAQILSDYQDVVIDRWAPSEWVYGTVFRDGPSYEVDQVIDFYNANEDITWIYCRNDNAAANHREHMNLRPEMFDDMTEVAKKFDQFVEEHPRLNWAVYDYEKVDMKKFVESLGKKALETVNEE